MSIKPLEDRVVVLPLEAEEKTRGGIVLPDTAKEKPQRGRVVAVGKGKTLDSGETAKPLVKVGDEVIYEKYAGTEVIIDEVEHVILREANVLARLEK